MINMTRKEFMGGAAAFAAAGSFAAETQESPMLAKTKKWFKEAQFGMMAHWGLYTLPGGEWNGKPGRRAYAEWPLFTTFIDNIEMSLAKTDDGIARLYLALGGRDDLSQKVLDEMALTKKWVLAILDEEYPLQHRHVLGPVVRVRLPFVNALSIAQVRALARLRLENDTLTPEERERLIFLILCTVSGVAAGLQNTG